MPDANTPEDPAQMFADALRKEVREILSPQVAALSAADSALLILMVGITDRLISRGLLDRDELISMASKIGQPREGDIVQLQKVRHTIADLFARGLGSPDSRRTDAQKDE